MSIPESMTFHGSDNYEILASYASVTNQQPLEVQHKLHAVRTKYLEDFGLDGFRERFNSRTVAQVLSDFSPEVMNRLLERRFLWKNTCTTALTGSADALQNLECPKCGASLSIRFDPASLQPDGTTDGFLIINCAACNGGCCADKIKTPPPWVSTLGLNIQTKKCDGIAN